MHLDEIHGDDHEGGICHRDGGGLFFCFLQDYSHTPIYSNALRNAAKLCGMNLTSYSLGCVVKAP